MATILPVSSNGVSAFPQPPAPEMTIDALMQRQKEIALERSRIQPGNIVSPTQGFAYLGNILANKVNQGRADRQLAQERALLAQAMSGIDWESGPSGAQIASVMSRDPDIGMQLVTAARDAVLAARARQQTLDDRAEQRTYDERIDRDKYVRERGDVAEDAKRAELERIATEERAQAGQIEDEERARLAAEKQRAAEAAAGKRRMVTGDEAVRLGGRADRVYEVTADGTDIEDVTPDVPDQFRPLTPEERQQYGITGGGKWNITKNEPEAMGTQPIPQKPLSTKDVLAERKDYITFDTGVRQLQKALGLLGQGIDTGLLAGLRTDAANVPVLGTILGADKETADRTRQFNDIMNSQATQQMAQVLKGATTDTEMARFMEQMNNPRLTPSQKQDMLVEFLLAPAQSRLDLARETILENGGQVPELADPGSSIAPLGVSEDDIQETMRAMGMTREQVLERLRAEGR